MEPERNAAKQEDIEQSTKGGQGLRLTEYLCQRDIEALAWHLHDGHSLSQIAQWHNTNRSTVKRRIDKAIKTLVEAGIPVAGLKRDRVKVVAMSKLGMDESVGLEDL